MEKKKKTTFTFVKGSGYELPNKSELHSNNNLISEQSSILTDKQQNVTSDSYRRKMITQMIARSVIASNRCPNCDRELVIHQNGSR